MQEVNYTITKSTVECYKIRHTKSFYWADITVDHNGGTGRISIASDFGDYQYYWGACGDSFKKFLCKIGIHYAADKFGADRWVDVAKTLRMYKDQILNDRRIDCIEADKARKIFDAILTIEENASHTVESISYEMQQQEVFMEHWDYTPDICYSITPQFLNFWKEIWPVFIQQLQEEEKLVEVTV